MATRSTIWIKKENGNYDGVYCHYDGYLSGVGKTLLESYGNRDRVLSLISKGSLSSLGYEINPDQDKEHDFNNAQNNVCIFYHRDRREDLNIYKDITKDDLKNYSEEYNYFLDGIIWQYTEGVNTELKYL